jgi:hypothetical protein
VAIFKEATMRAIRVVLGAWLLLLLVAAFPLAVAADKNPSAHEMYPYDMAQQRIISGTVIDVQEYQCPVSGTVGTHITVKRQGETIEVHLAPAKFLKQYEIVINKGDSVEIQGANVTVDGKPGLLAKVIADGVVTYAFRDAKGKPLW